MKRLLAVLAGALALAVPALALADVSVMSPGQDQADQPFPGSSLSNATWSDLPNGLTTRPYVKSLAVVNGGTRTQVFSGGIGAAGAVQNGDVTAVVSPFNLCRAGQAPVQGQCYATPNRVGVAFGYKTDQGLGLDFSNPQVPLRQQVNANTVFEVVIGLNPVGKTLRWSWINGHLENWKTSGLGTDAGEVRVRLRPAETPAIDWQRHGPVGCTATPIRDCAIDRADGRLLGANLVLSLDNTLNASLAGAAFATQGAIAGFLVPEGSASAPALDLQIASSHFASSGALQRGAIQAFIPATALTSLYGVVPADASSFFTATRRGDAGTQGATRVAARTESDDDSAGVVISVDDITFSAPTYRVAAKRSTLRAKAATKDGKVRVSAGKLSACKSRGCTVTLYKVGKAGKTTKVASARSDKSGAIAVGASAAKLPKGSSYVVSVRKGGKAVASVRAKA